MRPTTPLLAAALALGLAACNHQDPGNDTTGVSVDSTATAQADGRDGMAAAGGGADASTAGADQLTASDRQALSIVEAVSRHEIAAAEDALAKDVQGDVRSYAETLRDEHSRDVETTRRLLDSGISGGYAATASRTPAVTGVADPDTTPGGETKTRSQAGLQGDATLDTMRSAHEAERSRLGALDGQAFADAWLDAMIEGHEATLTRLDTVLIPGATNDDVARHLRATRGMIAAHLDTARALQAGR